MNLSEHEEQDTNVNDFDQAYQDDPAPRGCSAVVVPGRMYLNNGDPGYPDEGCDEEALPGSEFCAKHQDADDPEDVDPDLEYDVWREYRDGNLD